MSCRSASSRGTRISSAPARRAISIARADTCSTSARGPSASMRSAAPTSGQSRPVAAFAATIASRSIISIAAGRIPAAMIPDTAAPASSVDGKVAKKVRVTSGLRRRRSVASVTIPRVPSAPTSAASRSYPGGSAAGPPRSTTVAVGEDHARGEDVVRREAVLQAVRAAGVLGDVAADRADALRRRIGRVVPARARRPRARRRG